MMPTLTTEEAMRSVSSFVLDEREQIQPAQAAPKPRDRRKPIFYDTSQRRGRVFLTLRFLLLGLIIVAAVTFTTSMLTPPTLPAHLLRDTATRISAPPRRIPAVWERRVELADTPNGSTSAPATPIERTP